MVIDRRYDRNCNVGRFELIYKQTMTQVPQYIGIDLTLAGTHIKRPWNNSTSVDSSGGGTFRANPPPNFAKVPTTSYMRSSIPNDKTTNGSNPVNGRTPAKVDRPKAEKPKVEKAKVEKVEKPAVEKVEKPAVEKAAPEKVVPPALAKVPALKAVPEKESAEKSPGESGGEDEPEVVVTKAVPRTIDRRPAPVAVVRPVRPRELVHRGPTRIEVVNLAQRAFAQKMPSINATGNQRGAPRASYSHPSKSSSEFATAADDDSLDDEAEGEGEGALIGASHQSRRQGWSSEPANLRPRFLLEVGRRGVHRPTGPAVAPEALTVFRWGPVQRSPNLLLTESGRRLAAAASQPLPPLHDRHATPPAPELPSDEEYCFVAGLTFNGVDGMVTSRRPASSNLMRKFDAGVRRQRCRAQPAAEITRLRPGPRCRPLVGGVEEASSPQKYIPYTASLRLHTPVTHSRKADQAKLSYVKDSVLIVEDGDPACRPALQFK